jgi:hypothetical protein
MVWLSHVDTDPAERWVRSRLEAFMSDRGLAKRPDAFNRVISTNLPTNDSEPSMPHLHLEYTANLTGLAVEKILLRLNNVLMASGQFGSEFDIKSRAIKVERFQVGTS